jgi:hypothetical protein
MIGLAKLDNREDMAKFPAEISLMTPGEINMKKGKGKGGECQKRGKEGIKKKNGRQVKFLKKEKRLGAKRAPEE